MTNQPEKPQAFPSDYNARRGMTLRDYFATHCPLTYSEAWKIWTAREFKTLGEQSEHGPFLAFYAGLRCDYADAMLKARTE